MASLKLEVKKKDLTWLIPLLIVLVVGVVYAYGTSNPSVMGHSSGELEIDDAFCNEITGRDCGAEEVGSVVEKYDSGWFAATQDTTYTKAHGLGVIPDIVQVWYSDTADGSGDVVPIGTSNFDARSPTIFDVDSTNVRIRTQRLAIYRNAAGVYTYPTASGYLKIVALVF